MSYLFTICLDEDFEQGRNRPVVVGSFREIEQILNLFAKELDRKFVKYETEMVVSDSHGKPFSWGDVSRVVGVRSDGKRIPLGYCNFERCWVNYYSSLDISTALMLILCIVGIISAAFNHNITACLWAFVSSLWIMVSGIRRRGMAVLKLMYLLK